VEEDSDQIEGGEAGLRKESQRAIMFNDRRVNGWARRRWAAPALSGSMQRQPVRASSRASSHSSNTQAWSSVAGNPERRNPASGLRAQNHLRRIAAASGRARRRRAGGPWQTAGREACDGKSPDAQVFQERRAQSSKNKLQWPSSLEASRRHRSKETSRRPGGHTAQKLGEWQAFPGK